MSAKRNLRLGLQKSGRLSTKSRELLDRCGIDFDPVLPTDKIRAIHRIGMGFFEKVAFRFPEPFWRADGSSHSFYICTLFQLCFKRLEVLIHLAIHGNEHHLFNIVAHVLVLHEI